MPTKKTNTIINFEDNTPVNITLAVEPQKVVAKERQTDWGPKKYYTYFCDGDKVFFATEMLHNKLQGFYKGDTLVVTKDVTSGKTVWVVNVGGAQHTSSALQQQLNNTEQTVVLRAIFEKLDRIEQHLGIKQETNEKKEFPTNEEDLGF